MPLIHLGGTGSIRILLIHGSPGDASQVERLALRLRASARVSVCELLDHGSAPDARGEDPNELVEQVRALLDELAPEPTIVVGTSIGGYVAARVAKRPPGHLIGAAFLSSFAALPAKQAEVFTTLAGQLEEGSLSTQSLADAVAAACLPDKSWHIETSLTTSLISRTPVARLVRSLRRAAALANPELRVEPFGVPSLVVHGDRDQAVDPTLGRELAALGQGEFFALPTASHYLALTHAEPCAELVLRLGRASA